MLCQKCGLQDATVHLETMVFRQKIEEHLCGLCAGARAGDGQPSESRASGLATFSAETSDRFPDPADPAISRGIQGKILQLLRLSKQQGYLTFDDLQASLPDSADDQRAIDFIFSALQVLGIEIVEADQIKDLPATGKQPGSVASGALDSVQQYLRQRGKMRALSEARERALFARIRKLEAQSAATVFSIPAAAPYFVEIGTRLLARRERPRRVVHLPEAKSPAQYFEVLPALLAAVRRHETFSRQAWKAHLAARTSAKRKITRAALRRKESALRSLLPGFCFKLCVYEEYLVQLQSVLAEIALLQHPRLRSHSERKPSPAVDPGIAKTRLRAIEIEHRISPVRLAAIARKLSIHVHEVQRTKTAIAKGHLREVIEIAKEHLNRGLSFVALITAGNGGLFAAIEDFNPRPGKPFAVFATPWIRQAIARAVAQNSAP